MNYFIKLMEIPFILHVACAKAFQSTEGNENEGMKI